MYDGSDTEDTEPPTPVVSRPRGAKRPRVGRRPVTPAVDPSRATPPVPRRPKLSTSLREIFRQRSGTVWLESAHTVRYPLINKYD